MLQSKCQHNHVSFLKRNTDHLHYIRNTLIMRAVPKTVLWSVKATFTSNPYLSRFHTSWNTAIIYPLYSQYIFKTQVWFPTLKCPESAYYLPNYNWIHDSMPCCKSMYKNHFKNIGAKAQNFYNNSHACDKEIWRIQEFQQAIIIGARLEYSDKLPH